MEQRAGGGACGGGDRFSLPPRISCLQPPACRLPSGPLALGRLPRRPGFPVGLLTPHRSTPLLDPGAIRPARRGRRRPRRARKKRAPRPRAPLAPLPPPPSGRKKKTAPLFPPAPCPPLSPLPARAARSTLCRCLLLQETRGQAGGGQGPPVGRVGARDDQERERGGRARAERQRERRSLSRAHGPRAPLSRTHARTPSPWPLSLGLSPPLESGQGGPLHQSRPRAPGSGARGRRAAGAGEGKLSYPTPRDQPPHAHPATRLCCALPTDGERALLDARWACGG